MKEIDERNAMKPINKDTRVTEFIEKLKAIKPDTKFEVLTSYIQRCIFNYGIAFGQWRSYFRESVCKHNSNQEMQSLQEEFKIVYHEIQKNNHSKTMRKKIVEILSKQPMVSSKVLWNDLFADVAIVEEPAVDKDGRKIKYTKGPQIVITEPEPYLILKIGSHNINSFASL